MTDIQNLDGLGIVVDGIAGSVLAASSAPVAPEGLTQWRSRQWPVEELHAGCSDGL